MGSLCLKEMGFLYLGEVGYRMVYGGDVVISLTVTKMQGQVDGVQVLDPGQRGLAVPPVSTCLL